MTINEQLDHLLEEFITLPDETSREQFVTRPEIKPSLTGLLEQLVAKVDYYNRSAPQQSLQLMDLALFVAEKQGEFGGLGLANRAKANALRAVGRFQEALPFYSKAIRYFQQAKITSEEGRTYLGEIDALFNLGKNKECLDKGLKARRRLSRLGEKLNLAKLNNNLANLNHQLGNYQSALRLYNRAISYFEQHHLTDLVPITRVSRANTLVQLNRFTEAAADYATSRAFFAQRNLIATVAVVDTNLGYLLFNQGRYNEALETLGAARDSFKALGQPDKCALTEMDLGYCYASLNLHDEALEVYEQAINTMLQIGMRSAALWARIGRVQVLIGKGELTEAEHQLQMALESYDSADNSGSNRHAHAMIWLYRAQILNRLNANDNLTTLALCRQSKSLFEELKLGNWMAQSLILEADLIRQNQDWEAAEKAYQNAANALTHLNLPHLWYQLYFGLGQLKHARLNQEPNNIESIYYAEARAEYLRATEQVETIRAILRPEELRSAFMVNGLPAYEALVELCLRDSSNPARLIEAFNYVERSKSRSLLDMLAQNFTTLFDEKEPTLEQSKIIERTEQLRRELNWFYSQLHPTRVNGADENGQRLVALDLEKITTLVENHEQELAKWLRRSRVGISYSSALTMSEPLRAVRQKLMPDQCLIEYYILGGQILAFVQSANGLKVFSNLCTLDTLEDLQERLTFQANKFNLGQAYIERYLLSLHRAFNTYLKEFYNLLIAPLLGSIVGKRLIIVPHGSMHTLPFHAFFDDKQYLIEKFEISYAPSAGVLLHCLEQPDQKPQKMLAVGVEDEFLTGVVEEVRGLTRFFPESRLLVGADATLPNLSANLSWCNVLHLASHGVFREDNPLFSMIKLHDEWLSVHDVMRWRFNPYLVTLSACQTGLNRPLRGDELLGLARGFFLAGAYSMVVSLWSVSDDVTTKLMWLFYEALMRGLGRAAALRHAMLELQKDERYAHPHYWAGFIVLGRP